MLTDVPVYENHLTCKQKACDSDDKVLMLQKTCDDISSLLYHALGKTVITEAMIQRAANVHQRKKQTHINRNQTTLTKQ